MALGGVGKALAAMATTLLIDLCDPDYIINAGVAGGLLETQKVADLVISSRIIRPTTIPPSWTARKAKERLSIRTCVW